MATNAPDAYGLFARPLFTMAECNRALFEGTVRATREESLRFVNQGLERNARALEALRDCDGLSDIMAVDRDLIAATISDSIEGSQRLAKLLWVIAGSGLHPPERETASRGNGAQRNAAPNGERAPETAEARSTA